MTTRRLAALMLASWLGMAPVAGAHVPATTYTTPGHEAALAVLASVTSLVYFPAKVGMAAIGLVGGGLAGVLSGGDTRAAYAIWVPLAGGDYLVRPSHVDGVRPFAVFGTVYDDTPSRYDSDGSVIYDALYDYEALEAEVEEAEAEAAPAVRD